MALEKTDTQGQARATSSSPGRGDQRGIIEESKAIAYVIKPGTPSFKLLAYRIKDHGYRLHRLPGGGLGAGEDELRGLYRELEEETGIVPGRLTYLRKIGSLEYYKPLTRKLVRRHDHLLLLEEGAEPPAEYQVRGKDKDAGLVFRLEWLDRQRLALLDPELGQFLNPYNLPELFMEASDYGLERGMVRLSRNHREWRRLYEFEELAIGRSLSRPPRIDHIGSTSVEGLAAKPIVDILIGLGAEADREPLVAALADLGYVARGEYGIPGRSYFTKGNGARTMFHLHAFLESDARHGEHLRFARNLAGDPGLRRRYEAYKLASLGAGREAYTEGKAGIAAEILSSCPPGRRS